MQFMDVLAPLAALHIIRHPNDPMAVQRLLTPSIKLVINLPNPKDESSSRVPRSGVEPGPLASEASVLPLDHLPPVVSVMSVVPVMYIVVSSFDSQQFCCFRNLDVSVVLIIFVNNLLSLSHP